MSERLFMVRRGLVDRIAERLHDGGRITLRELAEIVSEQQQHSPKKLSADERAEAELEQARLDYLHSAHGLRVDRDESSAALDEEERMRRDYMRRVHGARYGDER